MNKTLKKIVAFIFFNLLLVINSLDFVIWSYLLGQPMTSYFIVGNFITIFIFFWLIIEVLKK